MSAKKKLRKFSAKSLIGKDIAAAIRESVKDTIGDAVDSVWLEIVDELKDEISVEIHPDNGRCIISLFCERSLEELKVQSLEHLVSEFMSSRDVEIYSYKEDSEFCDEVAADMEKQAKRLRNLARELRLKSDKGG